MHRSKRIHAFHFYRIRSKPLDRGAHFAEHLSERRDVRLAGGILDPGRPPRRRRGQQKVDRGPHAGRIHPKYAPVQAPVLGFRNDISVLQANVGAERFHALEVQVYGARSPGASAGKRHAGATATPKERAQHIKGGAHLLHQFIGRFRVIHPAGVHCHFVPGFVEANRRAGNAQYVRKRLDVPQIGNPGQRRNAVRKQRRRHKRQRRILGAAHGQRPRKRMSAFNDQFVHSP